MIVETIFSTIDENGQPNFAPMGLVWGDEFIIVRPYRDTHTYRNMISNGYGIANLTDDVLAYVQCGLYQAVLPHFPAKTTPGAVFRETCSWLEMALVSQGGSVDRASLRCRVLHRGWQKDFLGFCRASNAVVEATILATRFSQYDRNTIAERLIHYGEIVEKTGDEREQKAFQLVRDYVLKRGADD
jgi:hypothetical protein